MIEENPYSCEPYRASAWLSKEQPFPGAGLETAIIPPYHRAPTQFIYQVLSSLSTSNCPHSTDEKTEAQVGEGTCLTVHSDLVAKPMLHLLPAIPGPLQSQSTLRLDSFTLQTLSTDLYRDLPRGAHGLGETHTSHFSTRASQGSGCREQGGSACPQKCVRCARKEGNPGEGRAVNLGKWGMGLSHKNLSS